MTKPKRTKNDSSLSTKRPKAGARDVAHTLARAGLSAIPLVGGPVKELFAAIITPPITKRRDEWIESIEARLKKLEGRVNGFRVDSLSENQVFITTLMHATQVAIRNHQEEKLEALRNAVINSALPTAPEEDLQLMFLNFVDGFTVWHVRILKFLDDPLGWISRTGLPKPVFLGLDPSRLLEYAFLALKERWDFYDQIVKELFSKGLVDIEQLHTLMSMDRASASRTTLLGRQFISFITYPVDDSHAKG